MDFYHQNKLNDSLPHYKHYMLPFEKSFDIRAQVHWFDANQYLCWVSVAVYVVCISLLWLFMRNRSRLELRIPAALWNTSLAIFSLICVLRILPDLAYDTLTYGFQYSICDASYIYRSQTVSYWGTLFVYSKIVEFGDTIFLVLRKRQLTFLHIYHHISIAVASWFFVSKHLGCARWVPVINGSIHTFMYAYFAFKVMRINVPKWMSIVLTSLQICQMMFGIFCISLIWYTLRNGGYCAVFDAHVYRLSFIPSSYFILFCNFFYQTYIKSPKQGAVNKKCD